MKNPELPEDYSVLVLQDPESRVRQVKSVLGIFVLVLLMLIANNLIYHQLPQTYTVAAAFVVLVLLYHFITSDTTGIVAGMLLWTILLLASYMAWKNDGLYDTAIMTFPCILIFAFMLGGRPLLFPLVLFMVMNFYFLAYAHDAGILEKHLMIGGSRWAKANNLAITLLIYGSGIYLVSSYIKRLMKRLSIEIRKSKKIERDAQLRLQQDPLTALPNELVCQKDLEALLQVGHVKDDIVGVATLDLKNFQWVNTSLGHDVGNRVICYLADRLNKLMDAKKVLYRTSGNEFMVLVRAADYEEISDFTHQLLQAVIRPFQIESYEIECAGKVGIAIAPFDGTQYQELRRKSHTALARCKEDDEQNFRFFEVEMEASVNSRLKLVQDLKHALAHNEFELYYQPKVDLGSDRIIGAEALIRWHRPGVGLVSPATFIPVAEESGFIAEIGKWALERACEDCQSWHQLGYDNLSIAVNLSPVQFRRGNLPSLVFRALRQAGLDPHFLELEITESLFINDSEHLQEQIHQIVNRGISIAIDDFGTGYSNLNYLAKFNASTLKIDMSFVRNMLTSTQHLHIVSAIIRMSEVMELECVAEGVEDLATINKLKHIGCHFGQGYYWSKPLPTGEFVQLLERHS